MSYIAIIIGSVAAAGYIFSTRSYLLRYKVARESGHRLYLTSLAVGMVFLFITLMLGTFIQPLVSVIEKAPFNLVNEKTKNLTTGFFTIFSAYLASVIHNQYGGNELKLRKLLKEWRKSDFDYICCIAQNEFKPVAITLENRKAYVGFVIGSLEPIMADGNESYIRILPCYSGHRDKDTLKLILTNKYTEIQHAFENGTLKPEDLDYFSLTIPRKSISIFHIYNQHLYKSISGLDPDECE